MKVKLVRVSFAVHFGHYVLVVVVAERSAELVVVHVRLALALAPLASNLVRVDELELAVRALPVNDGCVARVGQEFEQELPQLYLACAGRAESGRRVGEQMVGVLHAGHVAHHAARVLMVRFRFDAPLRRVEHDVRFGQTRQLILMMNES